MSTVLLLRSVIYDLYHTDEDERLRLSKTHFIDIRPIEGRPIGKLSTEEAEKYNEVKARKNNNCHRKYMHKVRLDDRCLARRCDCSYRYVEEAWVIPAGCKYFMFAVDRVKYEHAGGWDISEYRYLAVSKFDPEDDLIPTHKGLAIPMEDESDCCHWPVSEPYSLPACDTVYAVVRDSIYITEDTLKKLVPINDKYAECFAKHASEVFGSPCTLYERATE